MSAHSKLSRLKAFSEKQHLKGLTPLYLSRPLEYVFHKNKSKLRKIMRRELGPSTNKNKGRIENGNSKITKENQQRAMHKD